MSNTKQETGTHYNLQRSTLALAFCGGLLSLGGCSSTEPSPPSLLSGSATGSGASSQGGSTATAPSAAIADSGGSTAVAPPAPANTAGSTQVVVGALGSSVAGSMAGGGTGGEPAVVGGSANTGGGAEAVGGTGASTASGGTGSGGTGSGGTGSGGTGSGGTGSGGTAGGATAIGGAAGSAGMTGGGGASSGTAGLGGASLPCDFVFCENFEGFGDGAEPQNERWTQAEGLEQMVVDSLKPARGERALHITWDASQNRQTHWIRTDEPFPTLANQHWGRLFVYIAQLPDRSIEYRHWVTVSLRGSGDTIVRVLGGETPPPNNILMQNSAMIDMINPGEDRRREDNVHIGDGEWHCFEWFTDTEADSYRLWRNGEPMEGANWDRTNPDYDFPPSTNLWLGWTDWHPSDANWEVYLDEFVLDDERIGCDR